LSDMFPNKNGLK